ncbi:hypothetical protein [Yoonia sp.]|jgi:hypothetical protein|uniref:hypothetical protein n=1 Tax=Yoonia sp. TaxID=2212373 RepID=UPI003D50337E
MKSPIEKELERLRYLAATKSLKVFIKYPEYWELMLLIAINENNQEIGIEDYLDNIATMQVNRVTVRNFIKDRVAEGTIISRQGEKKSRRMLTLSDKVTEELKDYFQNFHIKINQFAPRDEK